MLSFMHYLAHGDVRTSTRRPTVMNDQDLKRQPAVSAHPEDLSCTRGIVFQSFFISSYSCTFTEGGTGRTTETLVLHNVACL